MIKKIIKTFAIIFLLLLAFAFAAPFIFKGKIIALAREQINQKLNAKVDFSDISLSFFRHFPQVAASMSDLQIIGKDAFASDTLFSAKNIDISLNLMSIIKGADFKVYSIHIEQPHIHALVTKEGLANWDIMKPDSSNKTSSSTQKPFQLTLDAYSISNGYLKYEDAASNMGSEIIT